MRVVYRYIYVKAGIYIYGDECEREREREREMLMERLKLIFIEIYGGFMGVRFLLGDFLNISVGVCVCM